MEKPPNVPDDQQIEKRQLEDNIPTGQDVLSKMIAPKGFKALNTEGKAAVVKLFANLQSAHNSLANMASSIVDLGKVLDQFSYILSLAICLLIQLKLPPELCAPSEMRFEEERLTPEELFEGRCLNIILPHARHPKLATIPGKHPTCCLAATTAHLLLCKRMFSTKVSQATIAWEFGVENKKLHMAISGHKYDASKKLSHKKVPSGDKDKMDNTTDKPPKCKVAIMKKKVKDHEPPQCDEVTEIRDTEAEAATSKMDTEEELLDSDDDLLLDPFPPSQPKQFKTINQVDIPKKPCSK